MTANQRRAMEVKELLDSGVSLTLTWTWNISKAYGYEGQNICNCMFNGRKIAQCIGGNYDMMGATLAEFIDYAYHDELIALGITMHRNSGIDSVVEVLNSLGIHTNYSYNSRKHERYYEVTR